MVEGFSGVTMDHPLVQIRLDCGFAKGNVMPQGRPTIISPLLFLLMINDIPSYLNAVDMTLFAGDRAIYVVYQNIKTIEDIDMYLSDNSAPTFTWTVRFHRIPLIQLSV